MVAPLDGLGALRGGQGFFAIWAADHIWVRETSGWLPLALAVVKLPAVAMLQSRLKDRPERNAVLAFHGGVLLFYISSVPVMLLDQGWIGLTLVIESMLLLWLNRRVVHEGLRWVASFMAPIGLLLLFFALPQMKHAGDMAILNARCWPLPVRSRRSHSPCRLAVFRTGSSRALICRSISAGSPSAAGSSC